MVTLLPGGMLFTFNSKCWEGGGRKHRNPLCVVCIAVRGVCRACVVVEKKKVNQKAVSEK